MPKVVVTGGFLKCPHGGLVKLARGDDRLKIAGSAVVTAGMEAGYVFLPATAPPTPDNPAPCGYTTPVGVPAPCTGTVPATAGTALHLTVGGAPALLDTAVGPLVVADPAVVKKEWSVADPGQTLWEET
jgi:hypothetical protein